MTTSARGTMRCVSCECLLGQVNGWMDGWHGKQQPVVVVVVADGKRVGRPEERAAAVLFRSVCVCVPFDDGVGAGGVDQGQVLQQGHRQELVLHLVDHPALASVGVCVAGFK